MDILNPSNAVTPSTFGPAFDMQQDGNRLMTQMGVIAVTDVFSAGRRQWFTLYEIEEKTSISFHFRQLRHLRKAKFGSHEMLKRRRHGHGGTLGI